MKSLTAGRRGRGHCRAADGSGSPVSRMAELPGEMSFMIAAVLEVQRVSGCIGSAIFLRLNHALKERAERADDRR